MHNIRRYPTTFARVVVLLALATRVAGGQDSSVVTPARPGTPSTFPTRPTQRPIRLVFSGGLAVPTGGFATYHELGTHGSASAIIKLWGQKLRLRPEVAYSRFGVLEQKVRALVTPSQRSPRNVPMRLVRLPNGDVQLRAARNIPLPKIPDLTKLRDGAISSALGTFGNLELPLGHVPFQPYVIGGVGAMRFRTDVTTVGEALNGVQWGYNVGAGIRFKLGPLGGGLEARLRDIPVDQSKTFFRNVASVPVAFSLIF